MKLSLRIFVATGVAAARLCGLPPPADAQQHGPKLDRVLQDAHGGSRQRVIVRVKAGAGTSVEQNVLSKGNRIFSKHPSIGAFTAELSGDQLAELARNPNVESIGADADVAADTSSTTDSISSSVLRNTLGEGEMSKGTVIGVVSAGNQGTNPDTGLVGYAGVTSPGNAPSAITVGAVNTKGTVTHADDEVSSYSSRGPTWYDGLVKPDVVAPGHSMISVTDVNSYLYKQYPTYDVKINGRAYIRLSGTSMATAVTTGVVAAALEAHNWATAYYTVSPGPRTAKATKAMLQYTALPISLADGTRPDALTQGTGELNAEGSVRLAWLSVAMWANPAIATQYPQILATSTTIANTPLPWAARIIWGQQSVSGPALAVTGTSWATNILWGENITWGENILWGENIIWGENLVWGENIIWGENLVWGENLI